MRIFAATFLYILISNNAARNFALSFDAVKEKPHFEKTSFRVSGKIFMTLDEANAKACIKLSAIEQDVFALIDKAVIYPVPNKWGKQGWTFIELKTVTAAIFKQAVTTAYEEVSHSGRAKRKKS